MTDRKCGYRSDAGSGQSYNPDVESDSGLLDEWLMRL